MIDGSENPMKYKKIMGIDGELRTGEDLQLAQNSLINVNNLSSWS